MEIIAYEFRYIDYMKSTERVSGKLPRVRLNQRGSTLSLFAYASVDSITVTSPEAIN